MSYDFQPLILILTGLLLGLGAWHPLPTNADSEFESHGVVCERPCSANELALALFSNSKGVFRNQVRVNLNITFASGSSELDENAKKELDKLVELLNRPRFRNKRLRIEGHTDSDGHRDRNKDLSQRRADSVKTYLMEKGIPETRLDAQGYGETRSIADNETAEGREKNRRVEIVYLQR